jgi:alkane 1-monooxygenase
VTTPLSRVDIEQWRDKKRHLWLRSIDGDITRVNLHPRVRDKMLAKYAAAR